MSRGEVARSSGRCSDGRVASIHGPIWLPYIILIIGIEQGAKLEPNVVIQRLCSDLSNRRFGRSSTPLSPSSEYNQVMQGSHLRQAKRTPCRSGLVDAWGKELLSSLLDFSKTNKKIIPFVNILATTTSFLIIDINLIFRYILI
jgi:hypothetical protein